MTVKRFLYALCCACSLLMLGACSGNSYKLDKSYATTETFGFLVFVSESGQQYDDLWVNISGLNKTFLASTAQVLDDGEVQGMKYGAQQGTRRVMVRQKDERLLYQDIVTIHAGENTIIKLKD